MADVFISYAAQQRALTEGVARAVEDSGYSVWWDTDLLANQSFRNEIDKQLDASRAVIIIWTPQSVGSQWVLAEADHAWRQGKLINTHTADLPPHAIPKPFNQIHAVAVTDAAAVMAAVQNVCGLGSRSAESTRRTAFSRRTALLAGGVVTAVVVGGGIYSLGRLARDASTETLVGHSGAVYSVSFSPFGYISGSVEIIVWDRAAVPVPVRAFAHAAVVPNHRVSRITGWSHTARTKGRHTETLGYSHRAKAPDVQWPHEDGVVRRVFS
jgi:hypothetical protein